MYRYEMWCRKLAPRWSAGYSCWCSRHGVAGGHKYQMWQPDTTPWPYGNSQNRLELVKVQGRKCWKLSQSCVCTCVRWVRAPRGVVGLNLSRQGIFARFKILSKREEGQWAFTSCFIEKHMYIYINMTAHVFFLFFIKFRQQFVTSKAKFQRVLS